MARLGGLGKGLGALIPSEAGSVEGDVPRLVDLPIDSVIANQHQPRVHFDEESLAELAASIREIGVLQPILVRPIGDSAYELVAGERRWRAAPVWLSFRRSSATPTTSVSSSERSWRTSTVRI
jgi:ParB family chromosome partitioning protein